MELKKYTRLSLLLALSIVLNIIESFIPFFNIPGVKLGLANIISLFVIIKYGLKDALYLGVLRVLLVGMLRIGIFSTTFFFSLSGMVLSTIMMYIGNKIFRLSVIGVSILGSLSHSIGQIFIAIILLNNDSIIYYLPYLLIFSIPTGIITGIICKQIIKFYDENLNNEL